MQGRNKSSRFKGVSYDSSRGRWQAYVNLGKRRTTLGRYDSEEAAAEAYDRKAVELHGEFAATNRSLGRFAIPREAE